MNKINKYWEKRSQKYGNKIEGVLLKAASPIINTFLNDWMFEKVDKVLNNDNLKILDIGCGYGRLAKQIVDIHPKATVFGIDIAKNYVEIFNQTLGPKNKAIQGDIQYLPFKNNFFDAIFMVTTLMYVQSIGSQKQALNEAFRVLKNGGSFVIIERNPIGFSIFTLGGLVSKLRRKKHSEIPAVSFSSSYLTELINRSGGEVNSKQGLPIFTIFFFIIFSLSLINLQVSKFFLNIIKTIDNKLSRFYYSSLYISYIGKKKS